MFKANKIDKQLNLFSVQNNWNNYQKRRIENSWAKWFRENIFNNIDESSFEQLYSTGYSRPNTPVNVIVGLLIIKELMNYTDEEAMDDALAFDKRVQYALNTIDDIEKQGSENTLNLFRKRLNDNLVNTRVDLFEIEMKRLNDKIIEISKIDTSLKRIDSLMISSSCRNLNRIELVYEVNKNIIYQNLT